MEEALKGGATMVQFREKSLEKKNFDQILGEAKALRELTQRYHVPLIIDDNMDLAEACNADVYKRQYVYVASAGHRIQ